MTLATYIGLTLCLGGAAAFATGRALARNWRAFWQVPAFCLLLAAAIQFLHYALFNEPLLSFSGILSAYITTLCLGAFGFFLTRRSQMRRQYGFLLHPTNQQGS